MGLFYYKNYSTNEWSHCPICTWSQGGQGGEDYPLWGKILLNSPYVWERHYQGDVGYTHETILEWLSEL